LIKDIISPQPTISWGVGNGEKGSRYDIGIGDYVTKRRGGGDFGEGEK